MKPRALALSDPKKSVEEVVEGLISMQVASTASLKSLRFLNDCFLTSAFIGYIP